MYVKTAIYLLRLSQTLTYFFIFEILFDYIYILNHSDGF